MPLAWLPQTFLLAQAGARLGGVEIVLVILFGVVLVAACGGIAYGIWQSRQEREHEPKGPGEMGDGLERRPSGFRPAFPVFMPIHVAAAMGVGLPLGVFALAFVATGLDSQAHDTVIWIGAILIALAGVAGGTILALRVPHVPPVAARAETPAVSSDALDVAEQPH